MTPKNQPKSVIDILDLTVAYKDKPVLWDIDASFPAEKLIAIVGPNGAGKTTLIKSILGLIKPAAGQIKLPTKHHQIGYVPQRSSVDWDFPTNALDVVLMGRYNHLGWFNRPSKYDRQLALEALEKLDMHEFAYRQINQLSGGQQQRVFLARALVQESPIYLMDEPFVGVDATTEKAIITLLKELRKNGKTVLVVHHDLQTLSDYFDWTFLLNVRKIAFGPTKKVVTESNLKEAYGGRTPFIGKLTDPNDPQTNFDGSPPDKISN